MHATAVALVEAITRGAIAESVCSHFTTAYCPPPSPCTNTQVAATLGTPADVIKTRVMNQPVDANGVGKLYAGSIDCLKKTVAYVYHVCVRMLCCVQCCGAGSSAVLSNERHNPTHTTRKLPRAFVLSRIISVLVGSLHSFPAYRAFDCSAEWRCCREDGMASLYKGFLPSWMRMAPWSLAFFLSFEQLRLKTGMGAF
jgi:hypothetical protein